MSEAELKKQFSSKIAGDFDLMSNVSGKHLIENRAVVIDHLIRPKPSLIQNGFEDGWIGVEVKFIKEYKLGEVSKLAWQAISYSQSKFEVNGESVRPLFVLMHSNVSFNVQHSDNVPKELSGLLAFLEYGNVGWIEFDRTYTWRIGFGSHGYYNKKFGKNEIKNLGTMRNVGNLA